GGDRSARSFAVSALAEIELPDETVVVLAEAFRDEHWPLRRQAADCIRGMGPRAAPYLLHAAFAGDDNMRFWSRKVLVDLLGPDVSRFLEGMERLDPGVR